MESQDLREQILSYLPQQKPFRFVDRIIEVDQDRIEGSYRFEEHEYFYKGHFPGNPITPGVILTETMAQVGLCCLSIYLLLKEQAGQPLRLTTLFTEAETEFIKPVLPGQRVTVRGKKIYWRRKKLKSECSLYLEDGQLAAQATLSGMGLNHHE